MSSRINEVKYRKSLVKYVLSRINDNASAAEIVQDVNIEGDDELMEDVDVDEEFSALVKEISSDVSPDEYVNFDAELATAEPGIKIDTLGWGQKARAECIDSVINSAFRPVVISDESEDEVEVDKNERGPNLKETLEMLDKICQCPALDEKQVAMLGDVTQELENLRINEKKQTRIEHFFPKKHVILFKSILLCSNYLPVEALASFNSIDIRVILIFLKIYEF